MAGRRLNEQSLLEICLAMGRNGLPLGGSHKFHQRVGRSLQQDNSVYDMLDYAKRSGKLQKRPVRPLTRMLTSQGARRRRAGTVSLDDLDVKSATRRELPPLLKSSTPPVHRHSSFCDVLGPESCEQCRKNRKQNRFVRHARTRVTRSLPDIDKLLATAAGPVNAPEVLGPPRKPVRTEAVHHRVAFTDNPIAAVGRAQWMQHSNTKQTPLTSQTGALSKNQHGMSDVDSIQQRAPRSNSRKRKVVPRISHSELHRRVMDQHREQRTER